MASRWVRERGTSKEAQSSKSRNKDEAAPSAIALAFPPYLIQSATAGDHAAAHTLLKTTMQGPSINEFQTQLDEPLYEPTDRLVAKRGDQVVAHVLTTKHEMWFGSDRAPVAGLHDFLVRPECRRLGLGSLMLDACENQMHSEGAELAMLDAVDPEFFARRGWFAWPRQQHVVAGAREILSWLRSQRPQRRPLLQLHEQQEKPSSIRLLRAVELPALRRLYNSFVDGAFGPFSRSDIRWRWLVGRRAFDRIYVAIEGPDRMELDETFEGVVGYAIVRGDCLMELVVHPDHPDASRRLLERVCGDAIENDEERVVLHLAPHDPVRAIALEAGGREISVEREAETTPMAKVFDTNAFLQRLSGLLYQRVRSAGMGRKCELGMVIDDEKKRIVVSPKNARLEEGSIGRSYLTCSQSTLNQLLLGHWDVRSAQAAGILTASTRVATQIASVLFPPLPIWRPMFENQRAE